MTTVNDLIRIFRPIIQNGLIAAGYESPIVPVKQSYQPTQQGTNTGPTVYFHSLARRRYGYLKRTDVWDADDQVMVHTESQAYEITFQVNALVISSPSVTNTYTAADLLSTVAMIMQSDKTRLILNSAGIGIYRVQTEENPYFVDDRDNFEASPSFDFTLTYEQVSVTQDPVIQSVEYDLFGV